MPLQVLIHLILLFLAGHRSHHLSKLLRLGVIASLARSCMLLRFLLLAQGAIHHGHQHQQAQALQRLLHGIPPSRAQHANPSLAATAPVSAAAVSQQPSMASPSADCKQSSGEQLPAHHVKQRGVNPWAARFQNIWEGCE